MIAPADLRSGKTHRDENFPVASWLLPAKHRPVILAFYEFVRVADDIADHKELPASDKAALLNGLEAQLLGQAGTSIEADALRLELAARGLSPRHALDLLKAFRQDVEKSRYADWSELMDYCALSAMPVGRFVLDVHGEDRSNWPSSDAICAALQIINHLQDCGEDYRGLDRVYIPLDLLAAAGASVEFLGARQSAPSLRACIRGCALRVDDLLRHGEGLATMVSNRRLALEISVIHALARRMTRLLAARDPLCDETHLSKFASARIGLSAIILAIARRFGPRRKPVAQESRP